MHHDKSYYLEKTSAHKSFKYTTIKHGVSQPLGSEGKGEKPSVSMRMMQDIRWVMWHCDIPYMQIEDVTEPPGVLPLQNISLRLLITWTSYLTTRGKKSSLYQVRNPCVSFYFCRAKIPFQYFFPKFGWGKRHSRKPRHEALKMQRGFTLPGPNPARVGQRQGESLSFTRCVQ